MSLAFLLPVTLHGQYLANVNSDEKDGPKAGQSIYYFTDNLSQQVAGREHSITGEALVPLLGQDGGEPGPTESLPYPIKPFLKVIHLFSTDDDLLAEVSMKNDF